MTSPIQKLAGRIALAVVLVLVAAGTVFGVAATHPTSRTPSVAEPQATENAKASESPEPSESPDIDDDDANAPKVAESPDADESPGAAPSADNLARIVTRLAAAGITTTADELAALAKDVGLGGAVRVLRFADAAGKTPAEILALREAGKGWGVIARELKLDINPGNGSVMGQGKGHDAAAKAEASAARELAKAQANAARAAAKAARQAARVQHGAGSSH